MIYFICHHRGACEEFSIYVRGFDSVRADQSLWVPGWELADAACYVTAEEVGQMLGGN